ncbi:permease [mine drainage metagenome]|uniref:Permease n=1 Tax=mine drainage metagenome TaxID=410659 RepID=T0ZU03_9ZZZZ
MLQQYESYLIYRYYHNIRPHADLGGWVDTFGDRYADRYAEQLWDTAFAKAPEITLFSWPQLASSEVAYPGDRWAWADDRTSFNWNAMVRSFKAPRGTDAAPGWARVAGYALSQVNEFLGKLGKPIGIASYKPFQSSGEDFLQNYLGNVGIPINLMPHFPVHAPVVLLTRGVLRSTSGAADQDESARRRRRDHHLGIAAKAAAAAPGHRQCRRDHLSGHAGHRAALSRQPQRRRDAWPERAGRDGAAGHVPRDPLLYQ